MADRQLVHRGGLLQSPKQPTIEPARLAALLVEFVRALIRENPSSDKLYLALSAAKRASEASDAEMALLEEAVFREQRNSMWPEGFMP